MIVALAAIGAARHATASSPKIVDLMPQPFLVLLQMAIVGINAPRVFAAIFAPSGDESYEIKSLVLAEKYQRTDTAGICKKHRHG
jgi:hypothetical protein